MHLNPQHRLHDCGGTILVAYCPETYERYYHCARCGAFRGGDEPVLPSGTDPEANQQAWDAGDLESPDAQSKIIDRLHD